MVSSKLAPALAGIGLIAAATFAPPAAPANADTIVRPTRPVRHQFRQVRLPTAEPNQFRTGLWILNPSTGRVRLCVLGEAKDSDSIMTCSPWLGGTSPGRYQIMNMNVPRYRHRMTVGVQAGLWIVNYETGGVLACLIGDLDRPAASLKCSTGE